MTPRPIFQPIGSVASVKWFMPIQLTIDLDRALILTTSVSMYIWVWHWTIIYFEGVYKRGWFASKTIVMISTTPCLVFLPRWTIAQVVTVRKSCHCCADIDTIGLGRLGVSGVSAGVEARVWAWKQTSVGGSLPNPPHHNRDKEKPKIAEKTWT